MLYLPGGGAMLFLTDVDHVSFEKANETRQNNLQSATVSLQVVIGLCKRKETAALKSKPPFHKARENMSAVRRLFFFCRRPAVKPYRVITLFLSSVYVMPIQSYYQP